MRLALGTVQFGLPYGVANRDGQVDPAAAAAIIAEARASGIDTIDTAISYGESEAVLGRVGVNGFRVVTKLPELPSGVSDVAGWVERQIAGSLARLRIDRLAGVLLHRPEQLLGPAGGELAAALRQTQERGLAEKVGVSVYDPDILSELLSAGPIDLVQAPFNLIDRRLADSGWLERLRASAVEVHVRSIFLQGLLLMSTDRRPAQFDKWPQLSRWDSWIAAHPGQAARACVGFVQAFGAVDRLVVGVDSCDQLKALVATAGLSGPGDWPDLASTDEELINPARWSKA